MVGVNIEQVVMMGAALAAGAEAQAQTQDSQTISWEEAQALLQQEPIKDKNGEVVAFFDKQHGVVYNAFPTVEQEADVRAYVDNVNEGIKKENNERIAKFQNSSEYKSLGEEEQILAMSKFAYENNTSYYLGGNDDKWVKDCREEPLNAFMQTEKYKSLETTADRLIAQGEFAKKIMDTRGEHEVYDGVKQSIDTQTFLTLKRGMDTFDVNSAKVAAEYMREHYKDGHHWPQIERNAHRYLQYMGKEDTPENVAAYMKMEDLGIRSGVDADVTRAVLKAIDNDKTLTDESKEAMKLAEIKNYCKRTAEYAPNEKTAEGWRGNVLRYYPELAQKLDAEKQQSQPKNSMSAVDMMRIQQQRS